MFCLPSAGGSASMYRNWQHHPAATPFEIIPLEYPGHGLKITQQLIYHPEHLAEHLCQEILNYAIADDFILFGHSVGASLLWRIEAKLRHEPIYQKLRLLVISSRPAPYYLKQMQKYTDLDDQQLLRVLQHYNHFPDEIRSNPSALAFFLKIIRNDLHLSDAMLNDEISISSKAVMSVYGQQDPFIPQPAMMQDWQAYSTQWRQCHILTGDHFYFLEPDNLNQLLSVITEQLQQITS
ncbi:hypothetical protein BFG52_02325 [Acinetobacter larvae]|uniref:Thioesterase domain-containing protein n=2 Tax=Acinetobacter larvae TaxID=1789224 RepID=A0A1B2LWI1_9GAMM|nr:hypothetical protein BFG52_02325 [Acinetobacter larvae]